jgi:hypothetical protein
MQVDKYIKIGLKGSEEVLETIASDDLLANDVDDDASRVRRSAIAIGLVQWMLKQFKIHDKDIGPEVIKRLKDDLKIATKQAKMLEKGGNFSAYEYSHRLRFSMINAVNQVLYLYTVYAPHIDKEVLWHIASFQSTGQNAYDISKIMAGVQQQKQAWSNKKV